MIGKSLAHYEITGKLGEGGMGAVYLATDSKLQREVALKLLPQDLGTDDERMARFRREATVLAALNHPNIAHIHGLEHADGHHFLVMERAQGEDLQVRLRAGAIGVNETIAIALQIAAGLEEAHEKGVVHRDLKPANVMLSEDGKIKVLDFGLARAYAGEQTTEDDISTSPTITSAMTQAGVILGTAAYMSPEQARGKPVDRRADIWSFGVILYEMLTGTMLFQGETVSDTLAEVIKHEPDFDALPEDTPVALRWLIERCLRKQPIERLRDIGEARVLLESDLSQHLSSSMMASPDVEAVSARRPLALALIATAVVALTAGWLLSQLRAPAAPETDLLHAAILPPRHHGFELNDGAHLALSPDGKHLAFVASDSLALTHLWVHELSRPAAYMLTGTEGAIYPFWSYDGTELGFFADGKMKRIPRAGGVATAICDATRGRGGSWLPDDRILFAPSNRADIHIVSASGGVSQAVTTRDSTSSSHRWPVRLSDGEHFLYTSMERPRALRWSSIDGGEGGILLEDALRTYLSEGELVFARAGALWARPFDPDTRTLTGDERLIADTVVTSGSFGGGAYSAASNGRLIYVPGTMETDNRLAWYDVQGNQIEAFSMPSAQIEDPVLSPDGRQLAITMASGDAPEDEDIWIRDLARGTVSRVTENEGAEDPVWGPDQDRIAYNRDGDIVIRSLRGARDVLLEVTDIEGDPGPQVWTKDGRTLIYGLRSSGGTEIWSISLEDPTERRPIVTDAQWNFLPSLSPDEKWILYGSTRTDRAEIYLRDLEGVGETYQVSRDGGAHSAWSPNGNEIYYFHGSTRTMMVVPVEWAEDGPQLGNARPLMSVPVRAGIESRHKFQVASDGRFLVLIGDDSLLLEMTPVQIISDWPAALAAR